MALSRNTRLLMWISAFGVLIAVVVVVAAILLSGEDEGPPTELTWLRVRLEGEIADGPLPDSFFVDPEKIPLTLHEYAAVIEKAAGDPEISGMYLELDGPQMSMAGVQELRGAIAKLRAADKHCTVWSKTYENTSWYLATACDDIRLHPEGVPMVIGLSVTTEHFAGTFEKIGVQADYERVGTFKSAIETYEQRQPSAPTQEMYNSLLDSLFGNLVADTAASRGMTEDEIKALIDDPPITAKAALEKGMLDALSYQDELVPEKNRFKLPDDTLAKLVGAQEYAGDLRSDWQGPDKVVAVVHLQGSIIDGDSQSGGFGGSVIGDRTVVKMLDELAKDDDVAAVVLRIDSPGGSALASDVMWRAIKQLDAKKPVVASMGGVAASGGYYIAVGARKIFAQPSTITGSIGVFSGKFAISGLMEKVGVSTWTSRRGALAGLLSSPEPFTDLERAKLRERIVDFYSTFLAKVADGRGMTVEDVDAVAQGRVWTGAQALDIHLVDELGSLDDAVNAAKALAGIGADEAVGRRVLPRRSSFFEMLTKGLEGQASTDELLMAAGLRTATAPAPTDELTRRLDRAAVLYQILDGGGIAAMDPDALSVR